VLQPYRERRRFGPAPYSEITPQYKGEKKYLKNQLNQENKKKIIEKIKQ
jgi:hypothetical protein